MVCLFGSILASGGLDVTLIDTNRKQIKAISENGLRISGFGGERQLRVPIKHDAA